MTGSREWSSVIGESRIDSRERRVGLVEDKRFLTDEHSLCGMREELYKQTELG